MTQAGVPLKVYGHIVAHCADPVEPVPLLAV
jgi:hypothetical protein